MKTNNPALGNGKALPVAAGQHPHDKLKLMNAISILQVRALADDSMTEGEGMWGTMFMPGASLDHAIQLLIEVLEHVEAPWTAKAEGAAQ